MQKKWIQLLIPCFLLSAAQCGSHSLVFLSTGHVQPGDRPSFEQLTVFDGVPISHCDGLTTTEKFKPALEPKNLPERCEDAYTAILESLHVIPPLTNRTVYVVQRRRGCIQSANGKDSAFEAWSVNGLDFITFDPESQRWTAQSPSAVTVEHKWNNNRPRNVAFSEFIRQHCPSMIKGIQLRSINSKTDLMVFAKPTSDPAQVLLTCHVTSTDRSVSSVYLTRDGASSRTTVTGPMPGPEDGSVILRLTAWISLSQHTYSCTTETGGHKISAVWDGKTLDGRPLLKEAGVHWKTLIVIIGVLCVVLIITSISCLTMCLLKFKRKPRPRPPADPHLVEQFTRIVESVMSPDLQSVMVSFIQGSEINREYQDRWEVNISRTQQNHYDPENFAHLINGANQ
ncbi:IgG receptor FcRn large subunit p51-like isoform X2 [Trachinotus anak]|uniref:IgG receptor FcRn large subunit p51-like isoform X2 n=1 Tax=Trachinotus anak TaxID=443729 RepID=UPI0039F1A566